jgi:hypothetical protein
MSSVAHAARFFQRNIFAGVPGGGSLVRESGGLHLFTLNPEGKPA